MSEAKHTPAVEEVRKELMDARLEWEKAELIREAAPELLAALQQGRDLIAGDLAGLQWKRACRDFVTRADAAIAKAVQS